MALTDGGLAPEPTQVDPAMATMTTTTTTTATTYATPSRSDLAAVAATVSVVGVLMALLVAWLVVRLRSASHSQNDAIPVVTRRPTSTASYVFRPSFAPSEASSKFGFIRKPLRFSHRQEDGSWDFADPDPFSCKDLESKHRPAAPLTRAPTYSPRAHRTSTCKDEFGLHSPDYHMEPPPPVYCRESSPWLAKAMPPS